MATKKLVTPGKDLEVRTCNYVIDQINFLSRNFRYKPRRLGKTSIAIIYLTETEMSNYKPARKFLAMYFLNKVPQDGSLA